MDKNRDLGKGTRPTGAVASKTKGMGNFRVVGTCELFRKWVEKGKGTKSKTEN